MNAASREPQSCSMASLVARDVVSGPGVSRKGSRRIMGPPEHADPACSDPDSLMIRVARCTESRPGRETLTDDVDLEPAPGQPPFVDAVRMAHITHADRAPVCGRSRPMRRTRRWRRRIRWARQPKVTRDARADDATARDD